MDFNPFCQFPFSGPNMFVAIIMIDGSAKQNTNLSWPLNFRVRVLLKCVHIVIKKNGKIYGIVSRINCFKANVLVR